MSKAENTAKDLACSEDAVFVCLTITVLPMSLPIKNKKLKKKKVKEYYLGAIIGWLVLTLAKYRGWGLAIMPDL